MKLLETNIHEIETEAELSEIIANNENVMVCAGRMGPMCIPVYDAMEELEQERSDIKFYSIGFDSPEASPIKYAPECKGFMGLPFTVYYKNGKLIKATSSIQSKEQINEILDAHFSKS